jgi:O-antigen/teichoic acid export membrane protein
MDAHRGWRTVVRRFAALAVGEGAARLVGFFVVLLLARRLGPGGFGIVTLGLTLVAWFAFVVDSGTELLNVREVARRPERFRAIAEQMLGLRLVLSVVAAAIFVAGVELFARSGLTRSTVVLFAMLLPAIALNLRWMVLGVGGARAIAAGNVAARLVLLAGVLLFVLAEHDVRRVPFLELGAELTYAFAVLLIVGGRSGRIRPRADLDVWRTTLRQSSPLMVNGFARAAILSFDVLVIDLALGPHKLGIYGVASKPAAFATGAVGLFSLSYLSAFSATSTESSTVLHRRALRTVVLVCVPASAALTAGASLLPLAFGHRYTDAVPVLAVISWRIPLFALGALYANVLIAGDRQTALMWNNIAAAVVLALADIGAILLFGLMGAAVVSVLGAGLVLFLNHRSVVRAAPEVGLLTLVGDLGRTLPWRARASERL